MAQRTTTTAVQTVLGGDWDGSTSVQFAIDTATIIVDRVNTCATNKDITLTTGELELIERWLAAHFYAQSDKPYTNKSTAGASASFAGRTDMGLDSTLYGQTAQQVDYSGCLANINKRQQAGGFWLGKNPTDQTAYEDRR